MERLVWPMWTTETDDEGCWQIQHEDHGIGMMWVRFKNDRAVIRGMRNTRIEEYSWAVTDFVGEIGPTLIIFSIEQKGGQ
ncbi:MAG: hypothetical protein R2792_07990 [Saprospiraceae bacterium]